MFLKTDSSNVSFREYFYEGNILLKPIIFLIACVSKYLRVRIPGSPDFPAVEQLAAFEVPFEALPIDLLETLMPEVERLSAARFQVCKAYAINDVTHNTRYASVVMLSENNETVAWVRDRRWPQLPRASRFVRTLLYTEGVDGRKVFTTNSLRDLLDPPAWKMEYKPKLAVDALLTLHRERVSAELGTTRPRDWTSDESSELIEGVHAEFVAHQKQRNVFKEPAESEQKLIAELNQDPTSPADEMLPVIAAVRKIEQKQTQWFVKIFMLIASVGFFIGLGAGSWGWEVVLLLVPILFVHELGHLLAMKLFGYKNTQMFFVPFLGAAVTGRKLNVPGWKKAMVSLAGPVPSIFLGLGLGIVGVFWEHPLLQQACILTLVLNVFNLAPLLPLDGGWVAHVTLFSRSALMDILFRVGTVVLLFLASIASGDKILLYIGIAMAVGIPMVWRLTRIKEMFQNETLPPPADDLIPESAIRQIATKIQSSAIPAANVNQLAQATIQVYESLTVRPPSWPATLGIWTLHGGSVMAAVFGGILLAAAHAIKDDFAERFSDSINVNYQTERIGFQFEETQFHLGEGNLDKKSDLLYWEFNDQEMAQQAFLKLKDEKAHSCVRVGSIVMMSKSVFDESRVEELERRSKTRDYQAQALEIEKLASSDAALNRGFEGVARQRVFSGQAPFSGFPALYANFADTTQSQAVYQAISLTPANMEDVYAVPPWAPRTQLSDEQTRCRRLLAILDGRTHPAPWMEPLKLPPIEFPKGAYSQARMRQYRDNVEKRQREIEKYRQDWIQMATERAKGPAAELLAARIEFERQRKAFEAKLQGGRGDDDDESLVSPNWGEQLKPLQSYLGCLEPASIDYRFAAICGVSYEYEYDESSEDGEELDGETVSNVLMIYLQPSHDPAAALAGLMAWLRKQGCTSMEWRYQRTESNSDEKHGMGVSPAMIKR